MQATPERTPTRGRPALTEHHAIDELRDDASSRKKFLKMTGGAGAAGALSLLIAACGGSDKKNTAASSGEAETQAAKPNVGGDVEIVNYALTLEYLEADFYRQVLDSRVIKDAKVG